MELDEAKAAEDMDNNREARIDIKDLGKDEDLDIDDIW